MKSSSASFFAVVVAIISLVSAALLISSNGFAFALLAVVIGAGTAVSLFTAQNILNQIEEVRRDIDAFRNENIRTISSIETSLKNINSESTANILAGATTALPAPSSIVSTKSHSSTPAQTPVSEAIQPVTNQKESYQPFSGLPLSPSPVAPTQTPSHSSKLDFIADDPGRTNASIPLAPNRSSITSPNPAVSYTSSHENISEMESTQSFLPPVSSSQADWETNNNQSSQSLSPDATLGFASNSIPPVDPNKLSSYMEAPKPPSKTHSKIKKRYSTFAGLALNDESPSSEINKYREDVLTPPPAPPPPSQIKDKKRYSTFAGLALNDRSKGGSQPAPQPSNYSYGPSNQPPVKANPLSILSPSTVTNLGFSKNTDGMGVPKEEIPSGSPMNSPVAPSIAPSIASPSSAHSAAAKGARKRYQTFMGLSLSKTPQPMKRLEETPTMDATAPLAVSMPMPSYSSSAPAPSAMQAAINRGQQGNLVDGFCSLCGSPQAAANDYASSGSEPEFCWYCGAKLRN